ncbi:MAG: hypothetical protein RIR94_1816, partial [Bacteroidota bacterium]
ISRFPIATLVQKIEAFKSEAHQHNSTLHSNVEAKYYSKDQKTALYPELSSIKVSLTYENRSHQFQMVGNFEDIGLF